MTQACVQHSVYDHMQAPCVLAFFPDGGDNPRLIAKLRRRGNHVVVTSDSATARAIISQQPVDVALLFCPGHGRGLQQLAPLRATRAVSAPAIIALVEARPAISAALRAGADDVIAPPFHSALLHQRIQVHMALRRAQRETEAQQTLTMHLSRMFWHDLRNPIGNIRMGHYMLREIVSQQGQSAAILDNVNVSLDTLIETVDKFIHALQARALDPQTDCINLGDVVRGVLHDFQTAALRKRIALTHDEGALLAMADATLLTQALGNLVSNAIKFSPPDSPIHVSMESMGAHVRITVADHGPGIPEAERARMFQMFAKLTPRPTGGESSSGLGLWIVSQVMRAHGGHTGAEFPPEGGSRFWLALPRGCQPDGM